MVAIDIREVFSESAELNSLLNESIPKFPYLSEKNPQDSALQMALNSSLAEFAKSYKYGRIETGVHINVEI